MACFQAPPGPLAARGKNLKLLYKTIAELSAEIETLAYRPACNTHRAVALAASLELAVHEGMRLGNGHCVPLGD